MAEEMLETMNKRRKGIENNTRYNELDYEIKRKCEQAKEEWLKKECETFDRMHNIDSKVTHRKVKELSGKKTSQLAGYRRRVTIKEELCLSW